MCSEKPVCMRNDRGRLWCRLQETVVRIISPFACLIALKGMRPPPDISNGGGNPAASGNRRPLLSEAARYLFMGIRLIMDEVV
jgi:hypothetical protein